MAEARGRVRNWPSPMLTSFLFSSSDLLRFMVQGREISIPSSSSSPKGSTSARPIRTSILASVTSRMWFRRSSLLLKPDPHRARSSLSRMARITPSKRLGMPLPRPWEIRTFRLCVPKWILLGIASFSEYVSSVSQKPSLISKGKVEEMVQKNWVCDITKAKAVLEL